MWPIPAHSISLLKKENGKNCKKWYGMEWYGMVWSGMEWYGMVWNGMEWYGMVWNGVEWYGMGRNGPFRPIPLFPP
ncbi:unnamed protein product [Didymodactylos carnosus]|uniref:Uncharacterized protein n=1 Tax=Didymodactylos carnosus TaxID=1234261 RepID=A0A814CJD9_9BILA|nr:unnamed protein product [Didymodactylos carnosus]CAF3718628.1 unnamed protein product [Didymodactylos carnosus]